MRDMPARQPKLSDPQMRLLRDFGERLQLARLRRHRCMAVVCGYAGISRMTLYRAEQGSPAVALGTYLRILSVFRLENDLHLLAKDDLVGRMMQDLDLPRRR